MMINNKAESRWVIGLHSLAQRKYLAWKEWAAQHEHCGASQIIATDVFRCDAAIAKTLAPGSIASATARSLNSSDHRRRNCRGAPSSRSGTASIGSF